jgi:hypothetical protein
VAKFLSRIPDADYASNVYLEESDNGLKLMLIADDHGEVAVTLSAYGVRQLRLALSSYERHKKASQSIPTDTLDSR